jgi:ESF2/ABP1 family protein
VLREGKRVHGADATTSRYKIGVRRNFIFCIFKYFQHLKRNIPMNDHQSRKRRRLDSPPSLAVTETEEDPNVPEDDLVDEVHDDSRPAKRAADVLSSRKVAESRAAIAKTGVVYLSRVPPRLSPTKIRQLLSPFGSPVLRIFLAPESMADYTRRIKSGGTKRKQYTEGWVEFEDKKVAKMVAEMLNAQRIGNKKSDFLYDDLWCIKYLPKFKWHHLTEETGTIQFYTSRLLKFVAYQNASRAEKLRNEIAQEKRESQAFVQNSERSKMIQNIQRKKEAKRKESSAATQDTRSKRQFRQKSVVQGVDRDSRNAVLRKVFE